MHYHELIPTLLNELQKQAGDLEKRSTQLQKQTAANQQQAEQIRKLTRQLGTLTTQVVQEEISTERKIAELQVNHNRELRAMQAASGQRFSGVAANDRN